MPKKKLKQFEEFKNFPNAFTFPFEMKGKWNELFFKNENPIVLEIGCGKGEYTIELAQRFPEKNFIGTDLKSNRMWTGAKSAIEKKIMNVCFVRSIVEKINELFDKNEVSEIWITFPDPFPKKKHEKHRLTSPKFLERYKEILTEDGVVNFKTDNDNLFQYTLEILDQLKIIPLEVNWDVHGNDKSDAVLREIRTYYEKIFMQKGHTVKYLKFKV
ncbi:MAG: tRNA (guanosine(46)-N7)-methyltransferase TrmB [Bacteroidia bacterium]